MKPTLPVLLSINGGYVDTASYLALQGLFTSHVTGNFVTLGAAVVLGTSGVLAKLLALPMFCAVVFATRLVSLLVPPGPWSALRLLLGLKLVLLVAAAYLAIHLGPFHNGDGWPAIVTGMTLVAAMAIQNAIHRMHMASTSPTTIMTGNTTQVMIDLADLLRPHSPEASVTLRARLRRMSASIAAFASGCSLSALLYGLRGDWCFLVPPVIALYTLLVRDPLPAPGAAPMSRA
jgi:uncharacterized membrane protein YoaK (UPF0700 family)